MNAQLPRAFRWFWAGETVSNLGSWITLLTLQVIVVEYLHTGTVGLEWMNAARWLPYLLFGLILGALIDRVRRRPVMIASDLVRALLLIAAFLGTATLVKDSASQAFVPRLIAPRSLQSADARIDGTNAVAETAGARRIGETEPAQGKRGGTETGVLDTEPARPRGVDTRVVRRPGDPGRGERGLLPQ